MSLLRQIEVWGLIATLITSLIGGIVTLIFKLKLQPMIRAHLERAREHHEIVERTLVHTTCGIIFGEFDGQVQSEFLGAFPTTLFGSVLFETITEWPKNHPAECLVVPHDENHAERLRRIATSEGQPLILRSNGIGMYFNGVATHGTATYRFTKFLVAIAHPGVDRVVGHAQPQLIMIEMNALARIMSNPTIKPQWGDDSQDGKTMLAILRELGDAWANGRFNGIGVLEIALEESR